MPFSKAFAQSDQIPHGDNHYAKSDTGRIQSPAVVKSSTKFTYLNQNSSFTEISFVLN